MVQHKTAGLAELDKLSASDRNSLFPSPESACGHPSANRLRDSRCTSLWFGLDLVLPESNHDPSEFSKPGEVEFVTPAIVLDFRAPVRSQFVSPQRKAPAVPEVPVYENRNLTSTECEVGTAWQR